MILFANKCISPCIQDDFLRGYLAIQLFLRKINPALHLYSVQLSFPQATGDKREDIGSEIPFFFSTQISFLAQMGVE
jgi:hypothetical protein